MKKLADVIKDVLVRIGIEQKVAKIDAPDFRDAKQASKEYAKTLDSIGDELKELEADFQSAAVEAEKLERELDEQAGATTATGDATGKYRQQIKDTLPVLDQMIGGTQLSTTVQGGLAASLLGPAGVVAAVGALAIGLTKLHQEREADIEATHEQIDANLRHAESVEEVEQTIADSLNQLREQGNQLAVIRQELSSLQARPVAPITEHIEAAGAPLDRGVADPLGGPLARSLAERRAREREEAERLDASATARAREQRARRLAELGQRQIDITQALQQERRAEVETGLRRGVIRGRISPQQVARIMRESDASMEAIIDELKNRQARFLRIAGDLKLELDDLTHTKNSVDAQ